MGRVVQKWPQFKEGNRTDCGKVAASVYISTQWKAYNEYRKNYWGKGMMYVHNIYHASAVSLRTLCTDSITVGLDKQMMKILGLCLHIPALSLISWPSVTLTQGQYNTQPHFRSHVSRWSMSLRLVHAWRQRWYQALVTHRDSDICVSDGLGPGVVVTNSTIVALWVGLELLL